MATIGSPLMTMPARHSLVARFRGRAPAVVGAVAGNVDDAPQPP